MRLRAITAGCSPCATGRTTRMVVRASSEPVQHSAARAVPLASGDQGSGAFWLLDPLQDRYFNVHGPNFIIQRPETFAQVFPKLRLRWLHQREMHLVVKPSGSSDSAASSTALVRRAEPAQQLPVAYDGQFQFVDLTQLLEQVQDGQEVFVGSSTSPRRTKMIGFTCLRCNARTYKPINPLSFEEGTLVVQCGKCQCWHKIRDHLHLFHDMQGDLFFRASPITEDDIPEALRMPLEPFYWMGQEEEGGAGLN